jgi:hypothetical protein
MIFSPNLDALTDLSCSLPAFTIVKNGSISSLDREVRLFYSDER